MSGLLQCTPAVPTLFVSTDKKPRTVEGGSGGAQTYCTPMSASCAGAHPVVVQSEQNFQSNAHMALRNRVSGNAAGQGGIFTFYFKTLWDDDPSVPATEVHYYTANAEFIDTYQKRSLEPTYLISETFYSNGTIGRTKRRLNAREVRHSVSSPSKY